MPLLFYATNLAEEKRYDICRVDYCPIFAEAKSRGADDMNVAVEKAFQFADEKLDAISYDEYETIVFIGKSFGTIVGAKIAAQHIAPWSRSGLPRFQKPMNMSKEMW